MKSYYLIFSSKNEKSLLNAILFFLANTPDSKIHKYFPKKIQKKVITILKSPHVNKTAQEQFIVNTFSKQLSSYNAKGSEFLFFFKNIKENVFADLKFKVKFLLNKKKEKKIKSSIFHANNLNLSRSRRSFSQLHVLKHVQLINSTEFYKTHIKKFLETLDIYGEIQKG